MLTFDGIVEGVQKRAIDKIATIKASDEAKESGYFPVIPHKFSLKDCRRLAKDNYIYRRMFASLFKTVKVIKQHKPENAYRSKIKANEFARLDNYIINILGMDNWGIATLNEKEIFKGHGIPYKNVIVITQKMDKESFLTESFPDMDSFAEIFEVYGNTGIGATGIATLLRKMHFGAVPNHSVGGNIDYVKAAYKANLGFIGRHGMLITPESGPCNRIAVIYTNIENLNDFIKNDKNHSWGPEFCNKCRKCFRTCPSNAIYNEPVIDKHGHIECLSNSKCNKEFLHYACGRCISTCPFTVVGYDTLYSKIKKKTMI